MSVILPKQNLISPELNHSMNLNGANKEKSSSLIAKVALVAALALGLR